MAVLVSIALIIAALALLRKSLTSRTVSAAVAVLAFSGLFLCGAYYIADSLTGSGIDASVLYHLSTGFDGAAISDFSGIIILALVLLLLVFAISTFTYGFVRANEPAKRHVTQGLAGFSLLLGSFYLNPAVGDIVALYLKAGDSAPSAELVEVPEQFALADPLQFEGTPKNFILLYLESMERTYLDETIFPGLLPNLAALEKQALSFTDITEVEEASWTIAAMVAGQCGIPLTGSGAGVDQFLPGATCLGDLLNEKGYDLSYMGGADINFGGKGMFYQTHGFDHIDGREELKGTLDDPEYLSAWGLFDDSLYAAAINRYDALAAQDDPFGLVLLTVDTHHPFGYLSQSCGEEGYGDGNNKFLDVVHCADKMAAEFIRHVLESPAFEDTVLVVLSDHMAMPNQAREQLEAGDRRNLLFLFGEDIPAGINSKPGTTLDIGPTLLDIIGAQTEKLAFGRNLLGPDPTLRAGEVPIESLLSQSRSYLSSLWSFPQLDQGLVVDLENTQLELGSRYVKLPALLLLDEVLEVIGLSFDINSEVTLAERVARLAYDQRFVWVDKCEATASFEQNTVSDPDQYCTLIGSLGSADIGFFTFESDARIEFSEIEAVFDGAPVSREDYDTHLAELVRQRQFAADQVIEYEPPTGMVGNFAFRSAGYTQGDSWAVNRETGQRVYLMRGLTLMGLNADEEPVKLGHVDTCAYGGAVFDSVRLESDFKTAMDLNKGIFGAFAIVAHNSMICYEVENDLETLFGGTGLEKWRELWYEQPYVALFSGNGEVAEFFGERQTAMGLEAKEFIKEVVDVYQRQQLWLPRIAHAGGGYLDLTYTNSFQALDANAGVFDLIEIDLTWTSDGHLVCLHDWSQDFLTVPGATQPGPFTLAKFEALSGANPDFQNCTLETLADWLRRNGDVRIVTDIKNEVINALRFIAETYPDIQSQFIPQIYQPKEYELARNMGYEDVIWTLYRFEGDAKDVLNWITRMDLMGLTMHPDWVNAGLALDARDQTGVLSWTHTINSWDEFDALKSAGAAEIFTDFLVPANIVRFEVVSSGFGAGSSNIRLLDNEDSLWLDRGLTLVGLSGGKAPEPLARYDSCSELETGIASDPAPFHDTLEGQIGLYDAVVVIVHDSAICGDNDLAHALADSGLLAWQEVGFREPYIGLISRDGRILEFNGATESALHEVLAIPATLGP